jgi:DNA-directed RNA polymerase subunit M/transcription elongation factor TFIIS
MAYCDKCGALLTLVEAAGRETGTCNECLRRRRKMPIRRFRFSDPRRKQPKRRLRRDGKR